MTESPIPTGQKVIVLDLIMDRSPAGRTYNGFIVGPGMIGLVVEPENNRYWDKGDVAVTFADYGHSDYCWIHSMYLQPHKNAICGDCGLAMEDHGDYLCPKCRGIATWILEENGLC